MINFIPLSNRTKRFRISEDKTLTEFVDYDDKEAGMITTASLVNFHVDATQHSIPISPEIDDIRRSIAMKVDVDITSLEANAMSLPLMTNTKGNDVGNGRNKIMQASENLRYALAECYSLVSATNLLCTTNHLGYEITNGKRMLSKGLALPMEQLISRHRLGLRKAADVLLRNNDSSAELASRRNKYLAGLVELKRHWRLNRNSKLMKGILSRTNANDIVCVDCSYSSAGDKMIPSELADCMVPLDLGPSGPTLATRLDAATPVFNTLKASYVYLPGPSSSSLHVSPMILASTTLLDLSSAANIPQYSTRQLSDIHAYLVKKQHHIFACRLFAAMKADAMELSDQYLLSKSLCATLDLLLSSLSPDEFKLSSENISQVSEALALEELNPRLILTATNNRSFSCRISDSFHFVCSLAEYRRDESQGCVPAESTLESHQVIDYLKKILKLGLIQAQCGMMSQFRINLAKAAVARGTPPKPTRKDNAPIVGRGEDGKRSGVIDDTRKMLDNDVVDSTSAAKLWESEKWLSDDTALGGVSGEITVIPIKTVIQTEDLSSIDGKVEGKAIAGNVGKLASAVATGNAFGRYNAKKSSFADNSCAGILPLALYAIRAQLHYFRVQKVWQDLLGFVPLNELSKVRLTLTDQFARIKPQRITKKGSTSILLSGLNRDDVYLLADGIHAVLATGDLVVNVDQKWNSLGYTISVVDAPASVVTSTTSGRDTKVLIGQRSLREHLFKLLLSNYARKLVCSLTDQYKICKLSMTSFSVRRRATEFSSIPLIWSESILFPLVFSVMVSWEADATAGSNPRLNSVFEFNDSILFGRAKEYLCSVECSNGAGEDNQLTTIANDLEKKVSISVCGRQILESWRSISQAICDMCRSTI